MYSFAQMISSSLDVPSLVFLCIFGAFLTFFTLRARGGASFPLRPIALFSRLAHLAAHAVESDRPLYIAVGTAGAEDRQSAEAVAALAVVRSCVRQTVSAPGGVLAIAADGTLLAAALGIVGQAREPGGKVMSSAPSVTFAGPHPMAYAAGVRQLLSAQRHLACLLYGHMGAEALFMAESSAGLGLPLLGGSASPSTAALLAVSADDIVVGEDFFAAGAYLGERLHLSSLATQDLMRVVLILATLVGVVLSTLGYWA